jgi:hypothetical protein
VRGGGIGAGWWVAIALGVLLCVSFVGIFALGFFYMRERRAVALARAEELSAHRSGEERTSPAEDRTVPPSLPSVTRHVPRHAVAVLAGCSGSDVSLVEDSIGGAIEIGAPAYNAGDFAGCYETYRSTAVRIEDKLGARCPGPARALADGRATAAGLSRPSDRAWAMRDAFDGLLEVIERSRRSGSTL